MAIDFHSGDSKHIYTGRSSHVSWYNFVSQFVDFRGRTAADIGCGGGIYSKTMVELGATQVQAVDFSDSILAGAVENCAGYPQICFGMGEAYDTELPTESCDIVLERALIHHLDCLLKNFKEVFRILRPDGCCIVQDRTTENILSPPSAQHIRGHFYSVFPRLRELESKRRPTSDAVVTDLTASGFLGIEAHTFWEIRKVHEDFASLAQELSSRTGRSILHELGDAEIQRLIEAIRRSCEFEMPIVERDSWTVWIARKPGGN